MKNKLFTLCIALVGFAQAEIIQFTDIDGATGPLLENETSLQNVAIAEIDELEFASITTGDSTQFMNPNSGDFGINSSVSGEVSDRFDYGESITFSFNKAVIVSMLDFSKFTSGESFIFGSHTITYEDLTNKNSAYIESLSWEFAAEESITLSVGGAEQSISFDAITLTVVPEPASISLLIAGLLTATLLRRCRS